MSGIIRKTIAVLSVIILIISGKSLRVSAEEEYTEGELIYVIRDESITITGYFGNRETVKIPSQIAGLPVSGIASGAFTNTSVKELHIPETVMTIEQGAVAQEIRVVYVDSRSEAQTVQEENIPAGTEQETKEETAGTSWKSENTPSTGEPVQENAEAEEKAEESNNGAAEVSENTDDFGVMEVEVWEKEEEKAEKEENIAETEDIPGSAEENPVTSDDKTEETKKINPVLYGAGTAAVFVVILLSVMKRKKVEK